MAVYGLLSGFWSISGVLGREKRWSGAKRPICCPAESSEGVSEAGSPRIQAAQSAQLGREIHRSRVNAGEERRVSGRFQ
jgi:hypothetical protein